MPVVKARIMFRRWFHHRTRSDYRELTDDNEKRLPHRVNDWTTVPGLIVEDDEGFLSVEDDSQIPSGKKEVRMKSSSIDKQPIADLEGVVQRLSKSESFETLETEEESDLADNHEQSPKRERSIRWADDEGKKLVVLHEVEILPPLNVRVVILMLNPAEKIFEFVQCEFQTDERLTVSDLLVQLPFMASMESLKKQRYTALYRGEREMVNIISIQDYDIIEGEILVAVSSNANPKQSIAAASALLLQRSLIRAVQKAKLSGRALQRLMSSADLACVLEGSGPPHSIKSGYDEDEESRDDCRLVLRVLSRELGGHNTSQTCERQSSSDDDDDDDEQDGEGEQESNERTGFPFVQVPDLEDSEFRLFREAMIDPYSPLARGRMADVPRNLLSDEVTHFKPPFRTFADDNILWDEIPSDDETVELEPEPVQSFPGKEDGENQREQVEEYIGMTAFSHEFDTDDEDECIQEPRDSKDHEIGVPVVSTDSSSIHEVGGTNDEIDLDGFFEKTNYRQDMSDVIEPVPRISGSDVDSDDESSCLLDREVCELSHISEVDTLEENDDVTTALTLSLLETEEESTGCVSNIPEIESMEDGDETDPDQSTGVSAQELTRSFEDKAIHDAYAFYVAVGLLVGSVSKISSPRAAATTSRSTLLHHLEMQEAEV
ncbi:hypothetical protein ACA910_002636 [Epithemia clementina (nom. ined.)]